MLRFKEYLSEGDVPIVSTQREVKANLDDPNTVDELNRFLAQITAKGFANPHAALLAVSKTLTTYGIVLPQMSYLPEPCGEEVFEVEQWGMHPGYAHNFNDKEDGIQTEPGIVPYQNVRTAPEVNDEVLYVYFCYDMNVNGTYDTFCMVIDKEGLSTILATESVDEGWKPHTKSAAKAWGSAKDVGNPDAAIKQRNKTYGQNEKPNSLAIDVPPTAKTWKFGKK